jgi:hypothetical protein
MFHICPTADVTNVSIQFVMPANMVAQVGGSTGWAGDLKSSQILNLSLSLISQHQFEGYVRANVSAR